MASNIVSKLNYKQFAQILLHIFTILVVCSPFVAALLYSFNEAFRNRVGFDEGLTDFLRLLSVLFLVVGAIYIYFQVVGWISNGYQGSKVEPESKNTSNILAIDKQNYEELAPTILSDVRETLSSEVLDELSKREQEKLIQKLETSLVQRLRSVAKEFSKNALLNLGIGIGFSVSGILLAFMFTPSTIAEIKDFEQLSNELFGFYVGSRVTLFFMLQFAAFFFLKLYAGNLRGSVMIANEITNVEMKLVAIRSARGSKECGSLDDILKTLASTERNFILEKGQTTVDLQRESTISEDYKSYIDNMFKILGKQKE